MDVEEQQEQLMLEADEIESEFGLRTEDEQDNVIDTDDESDAISDDIQPNVRAMIEVSEHHDVTDMVEAAEFFDISDTMEAAESWSVSDFIEVSDLIEVSEHRDVSDAVQTRKDIECDQCIQGYDDIEDLYIHLVNTHYPRTWAKKILKDLGEKIWRFDEKRFAQFISKTHNKIFEQKSERKEKSTPGNYLTKSSSAYEKTEQGSTRQTVSLLDVLNESIKPFNKTSLLSYDGENSQNSLKNKDRIVEPVPNASKNQEKFTGSIQDEPCFQKLCLKYDLLRCDVCRKSFKTLKKLKEHEKQMAFGKVFNTRRHKHAANKPRDKAKAVEHYGKLNRVSSGAGVVTCMFCKGVFASIQHLAEHYAKAHPFVCGFCDDRFSTKLSLQIHYQTHLSMLSQTEREKLHPVLRINNHGKGVNKPQKSSTAANKADQDSPKQTVSRSDVINNLRKSPMPNVRTVSPTGLKNTVEIVIKIPSDFKNQEMDRASTEDGTCLRTGISKYVSLKCQVCNATLEAHWQLHEHMKQNHPKRKMTCEKCLEVFYTEHDIYKHAAKHAKEEAEAAEDLRKSNTLTRAVMCRFCKCVFASAQQLKEHFEVGNFFSCCVCDRCFPTNLRLEKHLLTHPSSLEQSQTKQRKAEPRTMLDQVNHGKGGRRLRQRKYQIKPELDHNYFVPNKPDNPILTCPVCTKPVHRKTYKHPTYKDAHKDDIYFFERHMKRKHKQVEFHIDRETRAMKLRPDQTMPQAILCVLCSQNFSSWLGFDAHLSESKHTFWELDHSYSFLPKWDDFAENEFAPDKVQDTFYVRCNICIEMVPEDYDLKRHQEEKHFITGMSEKLSDLDHKKINRTASVKAKDLECDLCGREFLSRCGVISHDKDHVVDVKCQCVCKSMFYVKDVHFTSLQTLRPAKCPICNVKIILKVALSEFRKDKEETTTVQANQIKKRPNEDKQVYVCDICKDQFILYDKLCEHKYNHRVCHICDKVLPCHTEMSYHMMVTHYPGEPRNVCHICKKIFRQDNEYRRHMATHSDKKNFMCDICGKLYKQSSGLHEHHKLTHSDMAEHHQQARRLRKKRARDKRMEQSAEIQKKRLEQEKQYVCNVCKKKFKEWDKFDEHKNVHRMCHICKEHFPYYSEMTYHVMMAHYPGEPRNACHTCKKGFRLNNQYKKHMALHTAERNFICEVCGKGFKKEHVLEQHKIVHSDVRPFKCHLCDLTFKRKLELQLHMEQKKGHGGAQKSHKCRICDQMFYTLLSLNVHKRNAHRPKSERKYKCNICSKTFSLKSGLNCHMDIHTGKKYPCPICKREYSMKNYIRRHIELVHKRPGRKARGKVPA